MSRITVDPYGTRERERLEQMAASLNMTEELCFNGPIRVGVDLGTANVVLAVLDENNVPVIGCSRRAHVVRDGIVVDFLGASRLLQSMKDDVEKRLGRKLEMASCAIPPGVHPGSIRIIRNTLEAAGLEVDQVVDEPAAAATALGVTEGAVIDVGGGTTGISILKDGKSICSADEATGGSHMTLVLAGANGMSVKDAEQYKLENWNKPEIFVQIRPVVEKMAAITQRSIRGHQVERAYVVGGACGFPGFETVFENYLGIPVVKPNYPLLVTPLGIAMHCKEY